MQKHSEYSVGDVFRRFGQAYEKSHPMRVEQRKALLDISSCRTAKLGGHLEECCNCGKERPVYNSCGNVSCPMCQGIRRRRWLKDRLSEMLPVPYFHSIFTLPHEIHDVAFYNQREIYNLLFRSAAKTLIELSKKYYDAVPVIIAVLHTWGQNLCLHPHVHILVSSGGLGADGRWHYGRDKYLFDVFEMSDLFKAKFLKGLKSLHKRGLLYKCADFDSLYKKMKEKNWVVNCQKPFAGADKVLEYLSRYVYRSAIANSRLRGIEKSGVSFDYKDYRDEDEQGVPKHKIMKLKPFDFMQRFLQHILPKGFRRCRFFGAFAGNKRSENLRKCQDFFLEKLSLVKETAEEESLRDECAFCGCSDFRKTSEIRRDRSPPITFHHRGEANCA
ncbi:MAG: IS91 family transposase [Lentisphaeraceae bacterium]|nr:IS91 family transposase [Lentisphaeraceae bacterium]